MSVSTTSKTRAARSSGGSREAFTLLELLVVTAILAVLISILLPALASARAQGTRAKCLGNMRAIAQGFGAYGADDEKGYTTPVHVAAEKNWWWEGEYEYGGHTGIGVYGLRGGGSTPADDLRADNRPLNKYLFGSATNVPWEMFECPTDTGIPKLEDPYLNFDSDGFHNPEAISKRAHVVTGTSYRLNNHIDYMGGSGHSTGLPTEFSEYFYGPYMRPSTHVPDTASTVILEEAVAEVAKWNGPPVLPEGLAVEGWHRKYNRFNVAFVDGHVSTIHMSGQNYDAAQYPDYWVLRGDGWRMDCYPREPIYDFPLR